MDKLTKITNSIDQKCTEQLCDRLSNSGILSIQLVLGVGTFFVLGTIVVYLIKWQKEKEDQKTRDSYLKKAGYAFAVLVVISVFGAFIGGTVPLVWEAVKKAMGI